jgi:hypothetical protein
MSAWQDNPSLETKVLVAVVLAVTKAQLCALNLFWANDLLPKESYAAFARSALSTLVLEPPNIQVAQALLLFTLYEWGTREFHRAWIYCGMLLNVHGTLIVLSTNIEKALQFGSFRLFTACALRLACLRRPGKLITTQLQPPLRLEPTGHAPSWIT